MNANFMIREPKEIESILLSDPDLKVYDEYATRHVDGSYYVGVVLETWKHETIHLDLEDLEALVECLKASKNRLIQMSKLT